MIPRPPVGEVLYKRRRELTTRVPDLRQPASEALGGPEHDWECRNEACPEYGQPVGPDERSWEDDSSVTLCEQRLESGEGVGVQPARHVEADEIERVLRVQSPGDRDGRT